MVSGGIAGNNYSIIAENATTSTATSLDFIFNNDAQLPAPGDVVVASIDQEYVLVNFFQLNFKVL